MNNRSRPIYVEAHIRSSPEKLWEFTQTPDIHERWDLRFTDIQYLPCPDEGQPQRFLYSTRIGFGLQIQGKGETVGNSVSALQQRTSALKFWSDDPKSLIREGSGYWKYTPVVGGVRFITVYDYTVRYGKLGKIFDRLIFRPLLGWATAWSFDRLRLWLEQGLEPGAAFRQSLVHAAARITLALVFVYQGVIPKLIYHHADEMTMLANSGIPPNTALSLLALFGWSEVIIGLLFILLWRARWLFVLALLLMAVTILNIVSYSVSYLIAAFNPVTLNLLVVSLAIVGLLSSVNLPSARRCLRQKPESQDEVNL